MNTTTLTINNATFDNVPVEMARGIEAMLQPYKVKVTEKTNTTKAKVEAPKAEAKAKVEVYTLNKDGKSVTIGGNGFIPRKTFYAVTCSLKEAGAKWDNKTKTWTFDTKKACTEWCKEQDKRA